MSAQSPAARRTAAVLCKLVTGQGCPGCLCPTTLTLACTCAHGSGAARDGAGGEGGGGCAPLESLIWHASDGVVLPIMANRRIEKLAQPQWDARSLPFRPLVPTNLPPPGHHLAAF